MRYWRPARIDDRTAEDGGLGSVVEHVRDAPDQHGQYQDDEHDPKTTELRLHGSPLTCPSQTAQ